MRRVLILGAKGTLGGQLRKLYPDGAAWDREEIDAADFAALGRAIASLDPAPEAVINCIAFNDVDGAEDRPQQAFLLNGELPGRLARLAAGAGIPVVHYSTNYVFDGGKGDYDETDAPAPLSVYGRSKLEGERQVAAAGGEWYVVRTAVIFGARGESDLSKRSFVELMLDLASRRDTVQAVEDEVNSVTYAPDLAAATARLLESRPGAGIYHLSNAGAASWYDFAREIFLLANKQVRVLPVPSSHFPRKAARPPRAVLNNTRLPLLRGWKEALAEHLGRLAGPQGPPG